MSGLGTAVGAQVWAQLQPQDRAWLRDLARRAGPGTELALVGGAVRDALLGHTPLDLDIVVSDITVPDIAVSGGTGSDVQALAQASGLPFVYHPAFGNATLTLPDGRGADLVRARRETYPQPGHNPRPLPGSLPDDLRRRDFGINALALRLSADGPPELLDVVGGLGDLQRRELRPLHGRSFHEDASRLVRAARLAARLKLCAAPELRAQVPDALAQAERTPRLWAELKLLLAEPRPGQAARVLDDWGAGALLPGLPLLETLDARQDAGSPVLPITYAAAVLSAAPDPDQLAGRLGVGERPAALLARALSDSSFAPGTPERQLREVLRPDSYPPLTGREVLALGVAPGPEVGKALAHLAGLRQAGAVRSPDEERAALRAYLAQPSTQASAQPSPRRGPNPKAN